MKTHSQMPDDNVADILHGMQIQSEVTCPEVTCPEVQDIYEGHLHLPILTKTTSKFIRPIVNTKIRTKTEQYK